MKDRDVWVFGHNDRDDPVYSHDPHELIPFSDEETIRKYLQEDLFQQYNAHYVRGGRVKHPRIIIFEWKGKAYAHLVVDRGLVPADEEDVEVDTPGYQEYVINNVQWYETPVSLIKLGIRNFKDDPVISHELLEKIKAKAGEITEYR